MTIVWQIFLCFCFVTTAVVWIIGVQALQWIKLMTKKWVEHDEEIEIIAKGLTEVIKDMNDELERRKHES